MNPEPSTEQAIKALQAQNAQFQELVMSLAKGQQELKTLIQKKKKKRTVLFNTGRRFGNALQNEVELTTPSVGKDSPQEREGLRAMLEGLLSFLQRLMKGLARGKELLYLLSLR